ncbi:MAG: HNH endonuclease [Anaerolineae bacterium CFX3]|jgi:hypothetical protein|nr:HNH endonuclease [Acidobacteriota bacterium]MCE7905564.1 HNH endonuclease [Anaerolineae bacterium CFX3]MCQ3946825.1 hypothetical protein [Anaerolineae bacterium]
MKLKWPENYQERIESIVGAKYDKNNYVYFLGFEFNTTREAKECKAKIQLMQKQLRQVKTEIGNKIKVFKSRRFPRARKRDGSLYALTSAFSNFSLDRQITDYQYVVMNIDKLLDACENRKIEIEAWIAEQDSDMKSNLTIRMPIPDDVQIFVWNRDNGMCVKCGSKENLEFDHIIPLSQGGSNTARNIQLLCEVCNRKKSNQIGG